MAVTYEQAFDAIRRHYESAEKTWTWGTFCLDDRQIVETDEVFVFNVGAREHLVDGDDEYCIAGGVSVVFKEDGRVGSLASVAVATDPSVRIRPNPHPTLVL